MEREEEFEPYPEMELALKLSQLEGAFKFLDYMNNGKMEDGTDFPRNATERSSVKTNLERIREVRKLYKRILNKNRETV